MANGKKVIIIGATSGIGRQLALAFGKKGYLVGVTGRRSHLLHTLAHEIGPSCHFLEMDVSLNETIEPTLSELIGQLKGMDILVSCAGILRDSSDCNWNEDRKVFDTNILGMARIISFSFRYFMEQGGGHIVGISSIKSHFGGGSTTAYNASKAFQSNLLEGFRKKARKLKTPVQVTTIEPGLVNTQMNRPNGFWRHLYISDREAGLRILNKIERRTPFAIVPSWWVLLVPIWKHGLKLRNLFSPKW